MYIISKFKEKLCLGLYIPLLLNLVNKITVKYINTLGKQFSEVRENMDLCLYLPIYAKVTRPRLV